MASSELDIKLTYHCYWDYIDYFFDNGFRRISGSSVVYNKDQSYLLHFKVNDTICVKREIKTDKKYRGYDFYLTNKEGQILYHFPDGTQNVCYMNNEYYYCIEQQLFCLKF